MTQGRITQTRAVVVQQGDANGRLTQTRAVVVQAGTAATRLTQTRIVVVAQVVGQHPYAYVQVLD